MPNKVIYRGDAYAIRRPLYRHELFDELGAPFVLNDCTVRTTFKVAPTSLEDDPTDSGAAIKGTLVVDGTGSPTLQDKLFLVGPAANGVVELRLTAAETAALDANEAWRSDVEVTDGNGEPFTFVFEETLTAVDGYTNRTS